MRLVACKKCKKEIEKKDKICPHCGVSRPGEGTIELLTGFTVLGIALAVGLTMCSGKEKQEAVATNQVPAQITVPQPTPVQAEKEPAVARRVSTGQTSKNSLDLAEARVLAKDTLQVINQAEQSLKDGIQLGDEAGVAKHVRPPLNTVLDQWPSLLERVADDQREHFAYCRDTVVRLQTLSYSVTQQQTVESKKYLRKEDADYQKTKQKCEQQVNATDSQIKAAVAAEDAELKEKFGGRECLAVYGVNKQTGEVVEEPKPAHCKK